MRYFISLSIAIIFLSNILLPQNIKDNKCPDNIPDGFLEVAVRQKSEGELSKGITILQLECVDGKCNLISVTISKCWEIGDKNKSTVAIERSSTQDGTLEVRNLGDRLEVTETYNDILDGEIKLHYLFGYQLDPKSHRASKVTSFSGGFVRSYSVLKRVISVELVPLVAGDNYQTVEVDLDCKTILLPGVQKNK